MKFRYIKLNDSDRTLQPNGKPLQAHGFPYEAIGVFNDGMNQFLIGGEVMGDILFEFEIDGKPDVKKADAAFLVATGMKKIPSHIPVQLIES